MGARDKDQQHSYPYRARCGHRDYNAKNSRWCAQVRIEIIELMVKHVNKTKRVSLQATKAPRSGSTDAGDPREYMK